MFMYDLLLNQTINTHSFTEWYCAPKIAQYLRSEFMHIFQYKLNNLITSNHHAWQICTILKSGLYRRFPVVRSPEFGHWKPEISLWCNVLQEDLQKLERWESDWQMQFNTSKFETLKSQYSQITIFMYFSFVLKTI